MYLCEMKVLWEIWKVYMYLGAVWIKYLKFLIINEERKRKAQRMLGVIKAANGSIWGHTEVLWACMHIYFPGFC